MNIKNNSLSSSRIKQRGFTLLEVLITLVILAIGLLGLAGMQAIGLKNNSSAYQRSQATQMAYDIADRMRANIAAIGNYRTSVTAPSTATIKTGCTTTAGCSATDMAENDLYEWNLALTNSTATLPMVDATITAASEIYTISITWDDDRSGILDANDPDFTMSFLP